MAKASKNILKYVGNDGELRLPVDDYLEGRRDILPERPEPPPPSLNVRRSNAQTKPWRRLTGDEHRYISRFEERGVPVNRRLDRRLTVEVHPPKYQARPPSTKMWRRLTGDEHRYLSQFEGDYPAFYVAHRRTNLFTQTNGLILSVLVMMFYIIWTEALWLAIFGLFLVPAVIIFKWVTVHLDKQVDF